MKIRRAIHHYLEHMKAQNFAARTIETVAPHLEALARWLEEEGVEDIDQVDLTLLRTHQTELMSQTTRFHRPPSISTQIQRASAIRSLFRYLIRRQHLLVDPARDLEVPRERARALPYGLPTPAEMLRILSTPDTGTPLGIRDRAILEVLYSTGLRNAELRALRVWDVDLEERTVTVVRGKGRQDRIVPLGQKARDWVRRYLDGVRPQWARRSKVDTLFLTNTGNPLHFTMLIRIVKIATAKAGVHKRVTVHTFRHACATHMLAGGADIRYLQQLLGHRSLASTTIYTQVEIRHLQRVHRRCHPRAGGGRRRRLAEKGRQS